MALVAGPERDVPGVGQLGHLQNNTFFIIPFINPERPPTVI